MNTMFGRRAGAELLPPPGNSDGEASAQESRQRR
jgi:hypothetical protein